MDTINQKVKMQQLDFDYPDIPAELLPVKWGGEPIDGLTSWDDSWLDAIGFSNRCGHPFQALATFQLGVVCIAAAYDAEDAKAIYQDLDKLGARFSFSNSQLVLSLADLSAEAKHSYIEEIKKRLVFMTLMTQTIPFGDFKFGAHSFEEISPMFEKMYVSQSGNLIFDLNFEYWFPRTMVGSGKWRIVARPSLGHSVSGEGREIMLGAVEYPHGWCVAQIWRWINLKWNMKDWVMAHRETWSEVFKKAPIKIIQDTEGFITDFQPRIKAKQDFYFSSRSGQAKRGERNDR